MRQFTRLAALAASCAALAPAATVTIPTRSVAFEPNVGQTDTRVKYLAHAAHATLWLTEKGAVLRVGRESEAAVVKLRFERANPSPEMKAEERRGGVSNYFIGNDPSRWRTGVPQFGKVRYRDVYPGIDAVFYGNASELEYDFVVNPGASPEKIRLWFDGAQGIRTDASGDLVVQVGGVEMRSRKPRIYQKTGAGERLVNGRYVVMGKRRAGFVVEGYDRNRALVVDPILSYATFLGGESDDVANTIARDSQGNIYVAGSTNSGEFPTKGAAFPGLKNATNMAFVAKLNPAATGADSLIYSTYLGGAVSDEALGIAVDAAGNAYVTGRTFSTNFPLRNAFQTSFSTATNCKTGGGTDVICEHSFVSEIEASGKALVYSSYLGGTNQDEAFAIAVDGAGNAYVAGQTFSTDFPTNGSPYQTAQKGAGDAFLCKVAAGGKTLSYSTYFGGTKTDSASALTVSPSGTVYMTGTTLSLDFPTSSNAFKNAASGGPGDSWVAVFDLKQTGASSLTYSTYLGGTNGTTLAAAITSDASGVIYVTGATNADDFPVSPGAFNNHYAGSLSAGGIPGVGDVFITKLDTSQSGASQLVYSTFFGGALDDEGFGITVDDSGRITVAGRTNSLAFPVTGNAFQRYDSGPSPTDQGFVARFDPSKSGGASLLYSTYLGGNLNDELFGVVADPTGNIVTVAGTVQSFNPPMTPGAFQTTFGGAGPSAGDAYIAQFDFTRNGPGLRTVLNGASLVDTGLSPGLIFTVMGSGIGPSVPQLAEIDEKGRIATTLAGVQLMVDNVAAPLLYVSAGQINAVAPYALANRLGSTVNLQVIYNGVGGNLIRDVTVIAAPAIFTSGNGQGIILNADGSFNGSDHPAPAGSTVRIFATGEGIISPPGVDGEYVSVSRPPRPVLAVSATIGGANASVSYAGTVPGSFEGFFEVDATIPVGIPAGNAPVILSVGNTFSTPVNVAVK